MTAALMVVAPGTLDARTAEFPSAINGNGRYVLTPVRFSLNGDQRIGARRSGLLCTPAGSVRWSEAKPDEDDARERVSRVLQAAGMPTDHPDDIDRGSNVSNLRLVPMVTGLTMSVCTAWNGIKVTAAQRSVKAKGRLAMTWLVYRSDARRLIAQTSTCLDFDVRTGAPTLASAILAALDQVTVLATKPIRTIIDQPLSSGAPVTETNIGCSPSETSEITLLVESRR